MMNATYSPEDNKLRLYSSTRLDPETYQRVKDHGFKWAPKQDLFVAPMWTPSREDLLLELCGEIEDEDKSLVERAEERAERFEGYSDNRKEDYHRASDAVSSIADNIPLGQPILVGHHSERHARKDAERIENGMRKAVKMWDQARYWESRAKGALHAAKYKELPRVRANRIKGLEADKRKRERNKKDAELWLALWSKENMTLEQARKLSGVCHLVVVYKQPDEPGTYWTAWDVLRPDEERYKACPAWTVEQVQDKAKESYPKAIAYAERWISHLNNRLLYEKTMLDEQGASDLLKPPERPTQLPLCNYRIPDGITLRSLYHRNETETLQQVEMTKAEYTKIYHEYKGTRIVENSHRIRIASIKQPGKEYYHRDYVCVFLTDSKVHQKPDPVRVDEKISITKAESKPRSVYIQREKTEDEKQVEILRDSLKMGIQTVVAPQLFPTPEKIAARMIDLLDIEPGMDILEPSAGTGNLIKALPNIRPGTLTAVEINYNLCDLLKLLADTVVNGDFLEQNGNLGTFDRIIMDPPFANGIDIKHIRHAYTMLKPGGKLVALCANGPRQQDAFKDTADYWEELPEGSFADQGTGVRVAIVGLSKD